VPDLLNSIAYEPASSARHAHHALASPCNIARLVSHIGCVVCVYKHIPEINTEHGVLILFLFMVSVTC
jgi:hypothetical protein